MTVDFKILLTCIMTCFLASPVGADMYLPESSSQTVVVVPTLVQLIFHYTPSKTVAAVAGAIYVLASMALLFRLLRSRDWWGLCLPIGAFAMGIGFFIRIVLVLRPNSLGVFIVEQLLVVCSPAAYLAFNYILYGRFIVRCVGREHSILRPEIVARTFVISDVTTFMIQAAGGSLESSASTENIGSKIFLVGLILQTASYVIFVAMFIHAHVRISKSGLYTGNEIWWRVVWLLYFSSLFILIRCIYRVIELGQGFNGFLFTHEIYFYLLDTLPLIIAISIYILFWPGRYIKLNGSEPTSEAYKMGSRMVVA